MVRADIRHGGGGCGRQMGGGGGDDVVSAGRRFSCSAATIQKRNLRTPEPTSTVRRVIICPGSGHNLSGSQRHAEQVL